MKTRSGFVSNSSSSSFIVALPAFKNAQELQEILFGEATLYPNPYPWGNRPESWDTAYVAETVYRDLEPISQAEAAVEYASGWTDVVEQAIEEFPVHHDGDWDQTKAEYEKQDTRMEELSSEKIKEWIKDKKHLTLYRVEYSDNDGPFQCALEHGGLFDNVSHLRISKH